MNIIPLNKPIEYSKDQNFLNQLYQKLGHSNLFNKDHPLYLIKDGKNYNFVSKKEVKIIKINALEEKKLK